MGLSGVSLIGGCAIGFSKCLEIHFIGNCKIESVISATLSFKISSKFDNKKLEAIVNFDQKPFF